MAFENRSEVASRRRGFTLIELMVVMIIILVLAGITVIFYPGINEQARAARGGVQLQGWLNNAKQQALRDQSPRGVRLFIEAGSTIVTKFQYVEQPEDFSVGFVNTDDTDPSHAKLVFSNVDLTAGSANQEEWNVKTGDYIEVLGSGLIHRIGSITSATTVTLSSGLPFALAKTDSYRIIRSPRVVGDELLELPDQVGVDINTNTLFGNKLAVSSDASGNSFIDILFGPSGEVVTPGVSTVTINLWVRDATLADPFAGEPSIIAVYVRSGLVAAHPPAPVPAASPYAFVDDGRSSAK